MIKVKRTIEDLWNGKIASAEKCGVDNPEIEHLVMLIERHKELLNQELGQNQKSTFEKYADCMDEYVCIISKCAFHDGFSLACKLMAEALSENL